MLFFGHWFLKVTLGLSVLIIWATFDEFDLIKLLKTILNQRCLPAQRKDQPHNKIGFMSGVLGCLIPFCHWAKPLRSKCNSELYLEIEVG